MTDGWIAGWLNGCHRLSVNDLPLLPGIETKKGSTFDKECRLWYTCKQEAVLLVGRGGSLLGRGGASPSASLWQRAYGLAGPV